MSKLAHPDHLIISKAVSQWYRHYNAAWDDDASSFLCDAAIELFNEGCHSVDEMATALIGAYVGLAATRVNAPSSSAVH
ncbi:hypothetical protein [Rhizobium redzepovicii]